MWLAMSAPITPGMPRTLVRSVIPISWYRDLSRPCHIDYCFLPRMWIPALRRVTVGVPTEWVSESDHVPIVVELDKTALRAIDQVGCQQADS